MTKKELTEFVEKEMMNEGETLLRDPEEVGPFAVALFQLPGGGYEIRVCQPATILGNKATNASLLVSVAIYGRNNYPEAARRFNRLVDVDLA